MLQGFPKGVVLFMGLTNLAYAGYSTTLAATSGRPRSRRSIARLVAANGGWVLFCAGILASTWPFATPFGRALVTFEVYERRDAEGRPRFRRLRLTLRLRDVDLQTFRGLAEHGRELRAGDRAGESNDQRRLEVHAIVEPSAAAA